MNNSINTVAGQAAAMTSTAGPGATDATTTENISPTSLPALVTEEPRRIRIELDAVPETSDGDTDYPAIRRINAALSNKGFCQTYPIGCYRYFDKGENTLEAVVALLIELGYRVEIQ